MNRRRLLLVGALLVVVGAGLLVFVLADRTKGPSRPAAVPPQGFGQVSARITDPSGHERKACLLAARTTEQQERGLMRVRDETLAGHDGMVFLFEHAERTGFWMRNTPMPLSIAYFDDGGRLVSTTDMAPCTDSPSCPSYAPAGSYTMAIEVPQGRLARLGIARGSRLAVGGACRSG